MENPVNISRVKLRKISTINLSFIFSLFGLISGLITGIIFFVIMQMSLIAFNVVAVPIIGLVLLSFVVLPVVTGFLFWITGLISGLLINLSLRIFRGLEMSYEELD